MRVLLMKPGYRAVLTILMVVKRDEREILEKDRDFRFPFIQLVSGLLVREKFTEMVCFFRNDRWSRIFFVLICLWSQSLLPAEDSYPPSILCGNYCHLTCAELWPSTLLEGNDWFLLVAWQTTHLASEVEVRQQLLTQSLLSLGFSVEKRLWMIRTQRILKEMKHEATKTHLLHVSIIS